MFDTISSYLASHFGSSPWLHGAALIGTATLAAAITFGVVYLLLSVMRRGVMSLAATFERYINRLLNNPDTPVETDANEEVTHSRFVPAMAFWGAAWTFKLMAEEIFPAGYFFHNVALAGAIVYILALAVASYYIIKKLLIVAQHVILRTETTWDDDLLTPSMLQAIAQLAPALVIKTRFPIFFADDPKLHGVLLTLTSIYIIASVVAIFWILIGNFFHAFEKRDELKIFAVKGIFQMLRLLTVVIGVVTAFSILSDKTPWGIITGFGAFTAALMLIFQDTILGLVASVQLSVNKMIEKGDWIAVAGHDANGEVIDISLTTIKVRNWDNTVTTVPPYKLVSSSFRNYQPMRKSGARRVDRSVYIDANTVGFCTPEQIAKLRSEGWLDGIEAPERTVNLKLLRLYLERYLRQHPEVCQECLIMIRQLQPTQSGLPLELYFFTSTTVWTEYERIQSDIFDHVYAVVRLFGLRIFQTPAGNDIKSLSENVIH